MEQNSVTSGLPSSSRQLSWPPSRYPAHSIVLVKMNWAGREHWEFWRMGTVILQRMGEAEVAAVVGLVWLVLLPQTDTVVPERQQLTLS